MPFWVFSSGPTGDPADDDPEWTEPPRIMRKAEELGVRDHVVFGGRVPPEGGGIAGKGMRTACRPSSRTAATGKRSAPGPAGSRRSG